VDSWPDRGSEKYLLRAGRLTLLPELATPVPFPFPLALDLIILIRPWQNRGELLSDLPGQGHYNYLK
jgi:hypothetical protein